MSKAGATFLYGAMCGFYTPEELDDLLFEVSEVARFLMEIESTSIEVDDEIEVEDRVTEVMRHVALASSRLLKIREDQLKEKQEKRRKKDSEAEPEEETGLPSETQEDAYD